MITKYTKAGEINPEVAETKEKPKLAYSRGKAVKLSPWGPATRVTAAPSEGHPATAVHLAMHFSRARSPYVAGRGT